MTRHRCTPAARLRGMAAGLLTAVLALAGHTIGSGAMVSGGSAALLCVLACTVGAVASADDKMSDARMLLTVLAIGQGVAHVTLSAADHGHHHALGPSPVTMFVAHAVSLAVSAALIAGADRLCRAVCTAMRRFASELPQQLAAAAATPAVAGDQPLRAALLLAASMSHRGPPVGLAR